MAGMPPISAQGSTLTVVIVATPTEILGIKSYSGFDGQASEIDVTDLKSTAKEYRLGLRDFGNFSMEINRDGDDPGQAGLAALYGNGNVGVFQLTLPNGDTYDFNALVKSFPIAGSVDQVVTGTVQLRVTGDVTEVTA